MQFAIRCRLILVRTLNAVAIRCRLIPVHTSNTVAVRHRLIPACALDAVILLPADPRKRHHYWLLATLLFGPEIQQTSASRLLRVAR